MTNEEVHYLRKNIDSLLYAVEKQLGLTPGTRRLFSKQDDREMRMAQTKLQDARMWLGQALSVRGEDEVQDLSSEREST